jgi:hypothetical protein
MSRNEAVPMRIPRLSREGTRELIREMAMPPADTPERRETFRRADAMHPFVEKVMRSAGLLRNDR